MIRENTTMSPAIDYLAIRLPRILLAADDYEVQKLLVQSLSSFDYEVSACTDGNDLLKHLELADPSDQMQSIDLIIFDLRMLSASIFQKLEKIRETNGCPPIILMTAFDDKELLTQARQLGSVILFKKPIRTEELLVVAHQMLSSCVVSKEDRLRTNKQDQKSLNFAVETVLPNDVEPEPLTTFLRMMFPSLEDFSEWILNVKIVVEKYTNQSGKAPCKISIVLKMVDEEFVVQFDSQESTGYDNLYLAVRIAFHKANKRLYKYRNKRFSRDKDGGQGRGRRHFNYMKT